MVGVIFIVIGLLCSAYAGVLFYIHKLFESKSKKIRKTKGVAISMQHKKDTIIRTKLCFRGNDSVRIKDLTKVRYKYEVDNVEYTVLRDFYGTPNQTPRMVCINCLKRFPSYSYIGDNEFIDEMPYDFKAFIWVCVAIMFIGGGFSIIFK